jgi:hypothetical protein
MGSQLAPAGKAQWVYRLWMPRKDAALNVDGVAGRRAEDRQPFIVMKGLGPPAQEDVMELIPDIERVVALADAIDEKYGDAVEAGHLHGPTYAFLSDIDELRYGVLGVVHGPGRDDDPVLWKQKLPEIHELGRRAEAWLACVGRMYLQAHRCGSFSDIENPAQRC